MRAVFDTNMDVSALLFRGSLAWLVDHWRNRAVTTLVCRDAADQMFVDLAVAGDAGVLVSGDPDLLALIGKVPFAIETPAADRQRWATAAWLSAQ
jgi:predicted nucleic acid-binding protein